MPESCHQREFNESRELFGGKPDYKSWQTSVLGVVPKAGQEKGAYLKAKEKIQETHIEVKAGLRHKRNSRDQSNSLKKQRTASPV